MKVWLVVLCACSTEPSEPVVCGRAEAHWYANDHEFTECTVFLGSVHVNDTVEPDFRWMPRFQAIEGDLYFFRNDGPTSLRGFEALERVGGTFSATQHRRLHDEDFLELASRIEIGGEIGLFGNAER